MSTDKSNVNSFNSNAVIRNIDIEDHETAARFAVRVIFDRIREENEHKSKLEAREIAKNEASEILWIPYSFIQDYASDFFLGEPYNRDALILAALCDDQIVPLSSGTCAIPLGDISMDTIRFAEKIRDEAIMLAAIPGQMRHKESLFLAHLFPLMEITFTIQNLHRIEDEEDLYDLCEQMKNAKLVIDPETEIGGCLDYQCDAMAKLLLSAPSESLRTRLLPVLACNTP